MKQNLLTKILISFLLLSGNVALAQEILLWPDGAPGSEGKTGIEKVRIAESGDHVVSNIHHPSITTYFPVKDKATGAALIIAPGGGHRELWIDHEGYNIAKWLSERGITVFVLKYRLAKDSNSTYSIDKDELADMQRAIRLVKSRAKEWGLDTARLGVMGFSAGGELAGLAAMHFDDVKMNLTDLIDKESSRPAFQALIYPGNSFRLNVVKNAPPIFILGGYEDRKDIAEGIAILYNKYKEAGVSAELHIYAKAGHGFGLRASIKGAVATWLQRVLDWMNDMGFLNKLL